jgi:hypothetical protein
MFTPWGAGIRARDWRGAVAKLLCSFVSGVCAKRKLHAWIHGLYPVWSFAVGKTPEVNPHSGFTTGTPDKPEFFAKQKMCPNKILK